MQVSINQLSLHFEVMEYPVYVYTREKDSETFW